MNGFGQWRALLQPGAATRYFEYPGKRPQFAPDARHFLPANAWWMSEICRGIYRREIGERGFRSTGPTRGDIWRQAGLVETHFFSSPHLNAALLESKGRLHRQHFSVLVFRGTTGSWSGWKGNLNTWPSRWLSGGWVHRGFKKQLLSFWHEIEPALINCPRPIFFTGHSLGGAFAVLSASLLAPQAVYTFGAPKVGSTAFVQSLDGVPIFRISNSQDIVTSLPWGYCHAGVAVQCHLPRIDANSVAPPHAHNSTGVFWERFLQPPSFLSDHAPINYSRRVAPHAMMPVPTRRLGSRQLFPE